jgi:hypothetical protein
MNTHPNSIFTPLLDLRTLGGTPVTKTIRTTRAQDTFGIIPGILSLMSRGVSMVARIFARIIADQRDRQAGEIIARYAQDRWSDWLERKVEDEASRTRIRF